MIKLIALDIDGTLLDRNGELSEANRQALSLAKARGVYIVLTTGRNIYGIAQLANQVGITNDPAVLQAGSLIVQKDVYGQWQVVKRFPIPPETICELSSIIDSEPVTIMAFTAQNVYIFHGKNTPEYLDYWHHQCQVVWNGFDDYQLRSASPLIDQEGMELPVLKVMLHGDSLDRIEQIYQRIKQKDIPNIVLKNSSPGSIDITHCLTNKKLAVELVANELNIGPSEVMALGDSESDLDLIQWAKYGAVMGNAPIQIKQRAPAVVPSNDENGVAYFINRHISELGVEPIRKEGELSMLETKLVIKNKVGLHARPASLFVQTANRFKSDIRLSYEENKNVNAKSILSVLTLGACQGAVIIIRIEGEDASQAMSALSNLCESNFGETE